MNYKMVRFALGRIILINGLLMLPSAAIAIIYGEGWQGLYPFLLPVFLCVVVGVSLSAKKPSTPDFFMREGFVVVGLSWLLISAVGALPFVISGSIPSFLDAFFEAVSGFTTTGASILSQPELLSHSQLFWRSFTHLIGGMGVLVFMLAVMPRIESDNVYIMKAEVPGPIFGKLHAKVRSTARLLYAIYLGMTLFLIILLIGGGLSIFDSMVHAFGAAGTGGFGIKSNSIAFYNSSYVYYMLAFGMLAFGVNFNLYYALLGKKFKEVFTSEELRWYLGFVFSALIMIIINTRHLYENFLIQLREVFFTVVSIITTTGYTVTDYDRWPLFSHIILLCLMFIGGMAGSTAGGLKVSRVTIYIKSSLAELRTSLNPNRRVPLTFEGKALDLTLKTQVNNYLSIYLLSFVILLVITSIHAPNFVSAFSSVAATLNNIGPGLDVVGPAGSYESLSVLSKIALSMGMIMGRLEIIPILVLLSPRTWRRT
ncbi:MAG TPA: TrkH family potassium uptake protein [Clostridiaceae bacterium]|nr:TrkH family potassium uptake protein [Clostridiaceae bacterium]